MDGLINYVIVCRLYTSGSASNGYDYGIVGSMNVTFAAGDTDKVVVVKIKNDYWAEREERIVLNIYNYSQPGLTYGSVMDHTIIIKDDIQDSKYMFSVLLMDQSCHTLL